MKKYIIIFIFLVHLAYAQDSISIRHLSKTINTIGAEINFFQYEKNQAFFTAIREDEKGYYSSIYSSEYRLGEWTKATYFSPFNSDVLQSGNIFVTPEKMAYFTFCNNMGCKIFQSKFQKEKWSTPNPLDERINLSGFTNTQPTIAQYGNQALLYFVSDRTGGFGGLDIWVCTIDSLGKFGNPVNCGNKINSTSNEISPFFHQQQGLLYFSSDRKESQGGYDIFTAKGHLTSWEDIAPLSAPFNTVLDEMYLTYYQESSGYFSSNRSPAAFRDKENCCNDIFAFTIESPTNNDFEQKINQLLPISLYFHNDEPDCCTWDTTTNLTYKDSYLNYFLLREEYLQKTGNQQAIETFFQQDLQGNFNKLDKVLLEVLAALKDGGIMELQIRGFASPLFEDTYNYHLSKRRIHSLVNYLAVFQDGILKPYLQNSQLQISELPFGEHLSANKVSDNPNDKKESVYSLAAVLSRKIEIVKISTIE